MGKTIASGLFIVRKDNKLLICHPTNHPKNFYSIPKGKVEDGEIFLEAAFRETYEETNLDLNGSTDFTIYPLSSVNYKHKKKTLYPFLVLENKKSNFDWDSVELKCNSNVPEDRGGFPEMDGYKWVTLDEAEDLLHYTQVKCLPKIKEIISE
jgi:putative (di)nucleoside polyphosphate hydrolase